MIAVLNYSISYCQNNLIPSTGVATDDTVCVPIEYIKKANVKLIELEYTKEINNKLEEIIINDDNIISNLEQTIETNNKDIKKTKIERNIAIGISSCTSLLLLTLLIIL